MRRFFLFTLGAFLISIDQGSKLYARSKNLGQLNSGGVFGLMPGWGWLLVVIFVLIVVSLQVRGRKFLGEKISWVIILSAGLSNALDRMYLGGVWDWIYYPIINVAGNLADITLFAGSLLLIIFFLKDKGMNNNEN